jgi:cytochrome P450
MGDIARSDRVHAEIQSAGREARLPPGPRGAITPGLRLALQPIQSVRDWQRRYGHTFTVNRLGTQIVFTAEPELIQQIYSVRDPELFAGITPDTVDVLLGPSSLFLLSGARHHRERKLMTPPFHGERMREWGEDIAEAGRRVFADASGQELRLTSRTQQATLDVIIRVIFGVGDEQTAAEFAQAVTAWTKTVRPTFLFVRALQREFGGLSSFARYRRARAHVDALLMRQIARVRANPGQRGDILTGMIEARYDDGSAMADEAIRDQLRSLLFAGHETSAVALAWCLHFVMRDQAVARRLIDELDALGPHASAAQIARLPYLVAVVEETLRLRPVTVDTFRLLRKPWTLGEWELPTGTAVSPASLLVHYRDDLWPEPERFDPERFLTGDKPDPTTYLPFGGGVHRCLGAAFALFEIAIMLGVLLREFEFEPLEREIKWGRGLGVLQPMGGVRMRVRTRNPRRATKAP